MGRQSNLGTLLGFGESRTCHHGMQVQLLAIDDVKHCFRIITVDPLRSRAVKPTGRDSSPKAIWQSGRRATPRWNNRRARCRSGDIHYGRLGETTAKRRLRESKRAR